MSNYKSFGSSKFIPEMKEEIFTKILKSNPRYTNDKLYKEVVNDVYP